MGETWELYDYHLPLTAQYLTLRQAGYYLDLNREDIRDFWGKQYKPLFDVGLEFVWQDMTTPAVAVGYGDMKGFVTSCIFPSMPTISNTYQVSIATAHFDG